MAQEDPPQTAKRAAMLEADELARYRTVLSYLEKQVALAQRARAVLEHAEFLVQSVDDARLRVWRDLCEAHGLDPEAEYAVDAAGRVFRQ